MDLPDGVDDLFTGVISDVLDSLHIYGQVASVPLHLVEPEGRVVGFARTARAVTVSAPPTQPYALLLEAIDAMSETDVLMLSAAPDSASALFGGLLATAVTQSGGAGVIVDGLIRDTQELRRLAMPTAARGVSPLDSYGRDEVVEIGGPVHLAGVVVHQGDFVLCDQDGTVVVPRERVSEVIALATEKIRRERTMRHALMGGMTVASAFEEFGVL